MEALDESFPQRVYAISPGRVQIMKQFSKCHVLLTDDTCLVFLFIAACYIIRASGKFDLDLQRTVKTRAAARNRKNSENVKQIFFCPLFIFPPNTSQEHTFDIGSLYSFLRARYKIKSKNQNICLHSKKKKSHKWDQAALNRSRHFFFSLLVSS